jgi:hypothetical protein
MIENWNMLSELEGSDLGFVSLILNQSPREETLSRALTLIRFANSSSSLHIELETLAQLVPILLSLLRSCHGHSGIVISKSSTL